jgi:FkbM family methyltransferase
MEWLKRRLRGGWLHRLVHRARGGGVLDPVNAAYDRQTLEVMARVVRPDSVCVDVGAHRGDILRHMVRLAPRGEHHAFEALPHLAEALRRNFPGVRVHETAVSDREGTAEFQHVENDPGYSGLRRRLYDRPDPKVVPIPVTLTTLDRALAEVPAVDFLKIDIEGGEYHALRGAVKLVHRCRPVIVFEAGRRSTGQYGVTSAEIFALVAGELDCHLTTMARWLAHLPPCTRDEFDLNWQDGPDYYFLAFPKERAQS